MRDANLKWLWTCMLALAAAITVAQGAPPPATWHTRLGDAQKAAQESGRPILAFFTDSAQCPWCVKLKKDVLDSPEFREWAARHVVLLEVDFPTGKPQEPAIKEQNAALKEKFGVRSYPVVIFMAADQKEIGRIPGYPKPAKSPEEARETWLKQAQSIVSR